MKHILIKLISLYQKTLSPDHGWFKSRYPYGYCRFYPSCSQYAAMAINEHGSLKGILYAIKRVAKCNPFVSPGVDKVPKKST
jgi:uncharacterized protein